MCQVLFPALDILFYLIIRWLFQVGESHAQVILHKKSSNITNNKDNTAFSFNIHELSEFGGKKNNCSEPPCVQCG